jgi:hypothetical protein
MKAVSSFLASSFALLLFIGSGFAAPVVRIANGANAAAIQAAVDQFRADLGTLNPNNGQSFTSGRREINWDGVPDQFSSPNQLPANFFNVNSPRGAVFSGPCAGPNFRVSANAANPTGTPVRFGELDPSYADTFVTFSAQKLFTALSGSASPCNIVNVNFFVPGTNIPATVSGFGVVFTDLDAIGNARVLCYDKAGTFIQTGALNPPPFNGGLSFVGLSFNAGERISQCQIVSGNGRLAADNVDGTNGLDVVAMDDFIYGEPRAAEFHSTDFDGDGAPDLNVFRPSTGQWFFIGSGANTFNVINFGQNGDIPIDGDFDGDSRADLAVFRPTTGQWFLLNSSVGGFQIFQFGVNGDKPVAADYDRDGRTDIAVWRPSTGQYFRLLSTNQFRVDQFGVNGDVPLAGAAQ